MDRRLIDANALAKWLDKEHYVDKPTGKCDARQNRVLGICISALKNPQIAPTIDAVPVVHGQWIWLLDGYYCSECDHKIRKLKRQPNFCERCGAKMDGGAEA